MSSQLPAPSAQTQPAAPSQDDRQPPHWDHRAVAALVYTGVVFGLLQLGPLTRPISSFLHGPEESAAAGNSAEWPGSIQAVQFLVALLVWLDLIYTREIKERRRAGLVWMLAILYLVLYGVVPWAAIYPDSVFRATPHFLLTLIGGVFAAAPPYYSPTNDRTKGVDRTLALVFTGVSLMLFLTALGVPGECTAVCTLLLASGLGVLCYVGLFVHLNGEWRRWQARQQAQTVR
jgi:peptidoglycan/LPS O-acetylase OafA/YrhL